MKQDQVVADVVALLKARNTLLWITSVEEMRVERALIGLSGAVKMEPLFWDAADGLTRADRTAVDASLTYAPDALKYIASKKSRAFYVLRDLHKWTQDPVLLRGLQNLARDLQSTTNPEQARALIVLSPSSEIPLELTGATTVIEWPIPDREETGGILDFAVENVPVEMEESAQASVQNGGRDAAIDAAVGLTAKEAENAYARSLVLTGTVDPAIVAAEKKRIIQRDRVLTWYDPDPRGLDAIGGLDLLKEWLVEHKDHHTARARSFGLPAPKGILICGVAGTGKSLTAKSVATAWGMPLLRLDPSGLRSKYVGESEQNIRKAFAVAKAVSPDIVWMDEIDKALAGSDGPQGDGGVASDALGTILFEMEEGTDPVFVVATANDVSQLRPELLRRFDAVFFVDLPTASERADILDVTLRQYNRKVDTGAELVEATSGFSGAEIAKVVKGGLSKAFADGERELTAQDLLNAAKSIVPVSVTMKEKVEELREWRVGRALPASTPETVVAEAPGKRTIEL